MKKLILSVLMVLMSGLAVAAEGGAAPGGAATGVSAAGETTGPTGANVAVGVAIVVLIAAAAGGGGSSTVAH